MMNDIYINISDSALSIEDCHNFIKDKAFGGNVVFVGTIRDHSAGKKVAHLEFEAYTPMAVKELRKIADKIKMKIPHSKIYCTHRIGKLDLTDIAVIIGISTKHRAEAFEACAFFIDELKKTVPIWKKEYWTDGSHWVNAHP